MNLFQDAVQCGGLNPSTQLVIQYYPSHVCSSSGSSLFPTSSCCILGQIVHLQIHTIEIQLHHIHIALALGSEKLRQKNNCILPAAETTGSPVSAISSHGSKENMVKTKFPKIVSSNYATSP